MEIQHTKPNFEDQRGEIRDLFTEEIDAITHITFSKGAVRGNHYHEHTAQWDYALSGSLECYTRVSPDAPVQCVVLRAGDLAKHPPGEQHAFKALEDSAMLSCTKGPRRGDNYEGDTIRLAEPLVSA